MVEATDELRERLAKALHEAQCGCPTWVVKDLEDTQYDDMAAALLPLVVAVVAEARTEGAIAELKSSKERLVQWAVHTGWAQPENAEKFVADIFESGVISGVGNQNAEPRWSANRLEEVLRDGLPDQNAEPLSTADPLHRATLGDSLHNAWRAGYRLGWDDRGSNRGWRKYEANPYPEADQKGTEQ